MKPSLIVGAEKVTPVTPLRLVTVTLADLLGWPKSAKGWFGNEIDVGLIAIVLATGLGVPLGVGVAVGVAVLPEVGVADAVAVVVGVDVLVGVAVAV